MVLRFLLEKEFKEIARSPVFTGVLIFFTALMLFFFPWEVNQELKGMKVTIVNNDTGDYSQRLIAKMNATPNVEIEEVTQSYMASLENIEQQRSLAIIVIPDDFSKDIVTNKSSKVQIMINAVDGTQAGLGQEFLYELIQDFATEIRRESTGLNPQELELVSINPIYRYNTSLDYNLFMLPGLLVIMLTMYSSIFAGISIVSEKEIGTIQQINVTPIRRHIFILAKIIPFWVIAILLTCISVPIIHWVYGLEFVGSFPLYLFCVLVFAIALSFMGVILSNMSETLQQAMFLVIFFILIFFLVSGLFSPVEAMPIWAKVIAYSNPLTYFIRLTRMIYLRGAGLVDIYPDLLVMFGFLILFGVLAVATQKKRSN